MTKKLKIISFLLLLGIWLPFNAIKPSIGVDQPLFDIKFETAGYKDLDNDGLDDDIYVLFNITFNKFNFGSKLEINFDLELPSGFTYEALFIVVTNYQLIRLIIIAYSTATESGDYSAYLNIKKSGGGDLPCIAEGSYTFDPPTKQGVGEPEYTIDNIE